MELDRLWGPSSLQSNGYRGKSGRGVKLSTHLHLEVDVKNAWSCIPLPQHVFMA